MLRTQLWLAFALYLPMQNFLANAVAGVYYFMLKVLWHVIKIAITLMTKMLTIYLAMTLIVYKDEKTRHWTSLCWLCHAKWQTKQYLKGGPTYARKLRCNETNAIAELSVEK